MRAFSFVLSTSFVLGLGLAALAQEPAQPPAAPEKSQSRAQSGETPLKSVEDAGARAQRLNDLFSKLKHEASATKAESIAGEINSIWTESGSATVDLLVQRATLAITKEDRSAAFDFLDQAIGLDPNNAESWNRRATLNYATDDYGKSLDDIRVTLRLEPRHYGAMMGLAAILEETDRKDEALQTYMKVLEIYPALKPAQDAVNRLSDELAGQAL
ncbi:tetratricopeptide repeat protein [Aureimonas psammosilenae]|uniref:tetratricopeptide repeat protein n=1 Tax=Aureimonas psammosilenae TaxID=2495496 RepID=UPI00126076C4|nr:hypothetical protein [Aureimonas psammosilenae]